MHLFRYAGWEPKARPKTYKPKPIKPAPSRTSWAFIVPPNAVLVKFGPDQTCDLPVMSHVLKQILLEVCLAYRVIPNELVGKKRNKVLVLARAEFVKRARGETDASFPRIGRAINKDHTTVIHAFYGGKRPRKEQQANDTIPEVSNDRTPCNTP
jgi:hypothetical protein